MRRYETIIIIRPNAGEDEITGIIDKTTGIIESNDGSIVTVDKWGLKKLAYLIKKEQQGHYVLFEYAGKPEAVAEMERIYRIDDKILKYIVSLVLATRDPARAGLGDLGPLIEYGASPRASINLALAAKANAFINQRGYVTPDDIRAIGMDVMRHRVLVSYEAEAEEVSSEDIIQRIFEATEVP